MNTVTLSRLPAEEYGIFGTFLDEENNPVCRTLERAYPIGDGAPGYAPVIPAGTYTCRRRLSPKFGYDVFQVLDVPGHDYIEIHIANWENQLEGCIAVGEGVNGDMITNSKEAFLAFMALQSSVSEFTLVIR